MKKNLLFLVLVLVGACNQSELSKSGDKRLLLRNVQNGDKFKLLENLTLPNKAELLKPTFPFPNSKQTTSKSDGSARTGTNFQNVPVTDLYISKGSPASIYAIYGSTGAGFVFAGPSGVDVKMASRGGLIHTAWNSCVPYSLGCGEYLWNVNPNTKDSSKKDQVPTGGINTLIGLGSFLYSVQGGTFWRIDPNGYGSRVPFSDYPLNWENAEAMAGISNNIYTIQGGVLWRTSTSGTVSAFSAYPTGWQGTESMAATNGGLFAVQGGVLWRVDINSGSVVPYSQYPTGWSGTVAMAAKDGFIYLVQGGVLWKVSTFNGTVAQLGNLSWTGTNSMTALIP